jgi:hypothetical protein
MSNDVSFGHNEVRPSGRYWTSPAPIILTDKRVVREEYPSMSLERRTAVVTLAFTQIGDRLG